MTDAIRTEALSKHYGSLRALKGVDLRVGKGELFGLLGPNGAGKSTLINILAGLVRPSAGRALVMGHDVVADYRQSRRSLGVVPQELVYDPFFTVREILRLQSGYFGFGRDNRPWIEELLQTLGLVEKADQNIQRLSGGMKRRVLIAQALVHCPPLVVLDEPTAGVDVELRKALWRLTRRLHAAGHTIVLTTHYLEEAEALCDRIAILNHGRVIALDTKHALLARHPFRLLRISGVEAGFEVPEGLAGKVQERAGGRLTLRLHKTADRVGQVLQALVAAGLCIDDLSIAEPALEDVFLELTAQAVET